MAFASFIESCTSKYVFASRVVSKLRKFAPKYFNRPSFIELEIVRKAGLLDPNDLSVKGVSCLDDHLAMSITTSDVGRRNSNHQRQVYTTLVPSQNLHVQN